MLLLISKLKNNFSPFQLATLKQTYTRTLTHDNNQKLTLSHGPRPAGEGRIEEPLSEQVQQAVTLRSILVALNLHLHGVTDAAVEYDV